MNQSSNFLLLCGFSGVIHNHIVSFLEWISATDTMEAMSLQDRPCSTNPKAELSGLGANLKQWPNTLQKVRLAQLLKAIVSTWIHQRCDLFWWIVSKWILIPAEDAYHLGWHLISFEGILFKRGTKERKKKAKLALSFFENIDHLERKMV